jgi:hypothetical protein
MRERKSDHPRLPRASSPTVGAKRVRAEIDRTTRALAALKPPRGDERVVLRVLAEFRGFSQAVQFLITAKGEDALGAAAAIAVSAKRARAAARGYGLMECVKLFG